VRTKHDWSNNLWSGFVAPRVPINEEKSKIGNGAATRRRRKEREGEEEGSRHLVGPLISNGLVWLSHIMSVGVTSMIVMPCQTTWLWQRYSIHVGYCVIVESNHWCKWQIFYKSHQCKQITWLKKARFKNFEKGRRGREDALFTDSAVSPYSGCRAIWILFLQYTQCSHSNPVCYLSGETFASTPLAPLAPFPCLPARFVLVPGRRELRPMEAALGALCRGGGWSYAAIWRFHPHDARWAAWFLTRELVFYVV
jgi:hypothetical protein